MKPPKPDPASQAARAANQLFAAESGTEAMDEATRKALAVRENMARLRELRLAKESQEAHVKPDTVVRRKPKRHIRVVRVAS
jgi:hypothetical protein